MIEDEDRQELLAQMEHLTSLAEKAYGDMYETGSLSGATGCYSEAKECFYDAIRIAHRLGMEDEAAALTKRLEHIKEVFRSQFS